MSREPKSHFLGMEEEDDKSKVAREVEIMWREGCSTGPCGRKEVIEEEKRWN